MGPAWTALFGLGNAVPPAQSWEPIRKVSLPFASAVAAVEVASLPYLARACNGVLQQLPVVSTPCRWEADLPLSYRLGYLAIGVVEV